MNKVQLFIEGDEIELNEDVQFAITRQYEEIINPTVIINDYTKTVSIPFTEHNNNVFGNIYSPDKMTIYSTGDIPAVGIYFNPLKKLDFRLVWNGDILMKGYAKMNTVNRNDKGGTYDLTLNGELGKLFQEMKLISFDKNSVNGEKYIIKGSDYVEEYINKDLVSESWNHEQTRTDLQKKYIGISPSGTPILNPQYSVHNYVGFAPNTAYDDNFDYKTFQTDINKSKSFSTELDERNFYQSTGIESETILDNGMTPRGIGEFRSYLQLPYIYWNKLFQIFQNKAEAITGYKFDLSSQWFNDTNPYWKDLVYIMKRLNVDSGEGYDNIYTFDTEDEIEWTSVGSTTDVNVEKSVGAVVSSANETISRYNSTTGMFSIELDDFDKIENSVFSFNLYGRVGSSWSTLYWNIDNALQINFIFKNANGTEIDRMKSVIYREGTTNSDVLDAISNSDSAYLIPSISTQDIDGKKGWRLSVEMKNHSFIYKNSGSKMSIEVTANWVNKNNPMGTGTATTYVWLKGTNLQMEFSILTSYKRTNAHFTLNDLWNNDYNPFTEILNYCKMFRIAIKVDDDNKKIKFLPLTEYFSNYEILDWTDKLCTDKEMLLTPITFENKYVLFNYKDNESSLGEKYLKEFGLDFGEKRLITEYNFNTDTEELFDNDITSSITNTDNVLSWHTLYGMQKVYYTFGSEIFIYSKDDDNKFVDNFGAYYFRDGYLLFDTTGDLRNVIVSDDTKFQQDNDTYFYSQDMNGTSVTKYPHLDIVKGGNMCLFNVPNENYTYLSNYSGKKSIYDNFWSDYVEERYSIQNKIVTCYMYIKPSDYIYFDFNRFIRIADQIYMINKIYDYDAVSNQKVKVDLVTIQDTDGYTINQFNA